MRSLRIAAAASLAALGLLVSAVEAGAYVYWGDAQHDSIGRAENDGTGVNDSFIKTGDTPVGVFVTSTHIYWANQNSDSIGRANIDGSGVDNSFITGVTDPTGVAANGSHVYWASLPGTIGRAKIDGTVKQTTFVTQPSAACGLAIDAGHVYWVDTSDGNPAFIGRASLDGTIVKTDLVTIPGTSFPCGVAVDASNVFWTELGFFGGGTKIGRANKTTGAGPDPSIIGDASEPCGAAVFEGRLYWANSGTNTIGRANTDTTGVNQAFVKTGGDQICGVALDSLASPPAQPQPPGGGSGTNSPAGDTTPPQTTIAHQRYVELAEGRVTFLYTATEHATFTCRLDGRRTSPCGRDVNHCKALKPPCLAKRSYAGLKPGRHVFRVWATDLAGNKDPTPAKRSFRVPAVD